MLRFCSFLEVSRLQLLAFQKNLTKAFEQEIYFSQNIAVHRPICTIKLIGQSFTGLMDKGADITILNSQLWPSAWQTRCICTAFIALGSPQSVSQKALPLPYISPGGQTGIKVSFIVPIPINVQGRDFIKEWGTVLVPSAPQKCMSPVSRMLAKMRYKEAKFCVEICKAVLFQLHL